MKGFKVSSRKPNGAVQWVATFAQQQTARQFVQRNNLTYAGHLRFFIEGEAGL